MKEALLSKYKLYINEEGNLVSEIFWIDPEEFKERVKIDFEGQDVLVQIIKQAKELLDDTDKEIAKTASQGFA